MATAAEGATGRGDGVWSGVGPVFCRSVAVAERLAGDLEAWQGADVDDFRCLRIDLRAD